MKRGTILLILISSLLIPKLPAEAKAGAGTGYMSLIIIDIQNTSGNAGYDYLQASITDALRKELKKRAAFREYDKGLWKAIADTNYIYSKDLHTMTAAINLGLLAKQDIVITGYFTTTSVNGGTSRLTGKISVYNIPEKKEAASFDINVPISGTMFQSIDKMAEDAAKSMEKVFPNREEWERSGLAAYADLPPNSLNVSFAFSLSAHTPSDNLNLSLNSPVFVSDFPIGYVLRGEYDRYNFKLENLMLGGFLSVEYAAGNYQATNQNLKIPGNLLVLTTGANIGWRYFLTERWNAVPLLGFGFAFSSLNLNFSGSNLTAVEASTNTEVKQASISGRALVLAPGVRFHYRFRPKIDLLLQTNYLMYSYSDYRSGNIEFALGSGYNF